MLPVLRAHPNVYVGQQHQYRRFLSAVLWLARSGAQWRLLPTEYGYWNAVYRRFARRTEQGVFAHFRQAFADDADLERVFIDSTIIRAHSSEAGAWKKVAVNKRTR